MTDEKEQAKLTATYVNGLAIAVFAVGGLAPVFSALYAAGPLAVPLWAVILIGIVCFATSAALHWVARRSLKDYG